MNLRMEETILSPLPWRERVRVRGTSEIERLL
jgi:hypothetical protein